MPATRGTKILGKDTASGKPFNKKSGFGARAVINAAAINSRVKDYMANTTRTSATDMYPYQIAPKGRTEGARTRKSETANTRVRTRNLDMAEAAEKSVSSQIHAYNSKHTSPHSSPDPHTPNAKIKSK